MYYSADNPLPFLAIPTPLTYEQWLQVSGETQSSFAQVTYPDPERSVTSYLAGLGGPPTLEFFLSEAARQWRLSWSDDFTAIAVERYIREGFGMAEPFDCPPDLSEDGRLDINDWLAFSNFVATGDPRADVNKDGAVNVADLQIFQNAFAAGCP
jgi:hypothetical protein